VRLSAEQITRIVAEVEAAGEHSRVVVVVLRRGEIDILTERRQRVPRNTPLDESNESRVDSG
jgi:hypothetical protein